MKPTNMSVYDYMMTAAVAGSTDHKALNSST